MAVVLIRVKSYDSRVWSYDSRIGVVLNEVKSCCIVWISYDGRMSVVFSRMKVVWGSYEGRVWSYEGRVWLRNLHQTTSSRTNQHDFSTFLKSCSQFLKSCMWDRGLRQPTLWFRSRGSRPLLLTNGAQVAWCEVYVRVMGTARRATCDVCL